jgi:hypothetical protein
MSTNFASNNAMEQTGALSFIMGKGFVSQILLAILVCTLIYIIFMTTEILYKSFKAVKGKRIIVLDKTVSSDTRPIVFSQNPNLPKNVLLPFSDNELTGAEFTYSFFIWINGNSIENSNDPTKSFKHVMHKGNPLCFPLMGPGVFVNSNTNTIRVYMNSSKTWNNYCDLDNIPLNKWVHVALVLRKNAVEVYINGNLDKKLNLDGAAAYQNFGDLYLFSPRKLKLEQTITPSINQTESLSFSGPFAGRLSNLNYFAYAISYTELQGLIAEGISKKTETQDEQRPPYLEDKWWVS